jgi:hypothetical protein
MRLNFFSHSNTPEAPEPADPPAVPPTAQQPRPQTGRTFPADEVVWGIVIRNGFDELDDPWYHLGTTQHAYLEGNDNVAICGFRPPQSGPRTRRRSRLGMPTTGEHPMCGMCARMVVAPRPRVPIPVQPGKRPVPVPVASAPQPVPAPAMAAPRVAPALAAAPVPGNAAPAQVAAAQPQAVAAAQPQAVAAAQPQAVPTSPWVKRRSDTEEAEAATLELASSHDSGLLQRGVRTESEAD